MPRICFYVSGHGFGHASRDQAVIEQLLAWPDWTVDIRTSAPRWFFAWLLEPRCRLHEVELDPGVVQTDAFHHDLKGTLRAWRRVIAAEGDLARREARWLERSGCDLVIADIVPVACVAADLAGVPCLAMGNFTWDWILADYAIREPGFLPVIEAIKRQYALAERYLRLPLSPETDVFARQTPVAFTARKTRAAPGEVRRLIGVEPNQKMILLSFGGMGINKLSLERVARHPQYRCVSDRIPPGAPSLVSIQGRDLHYPDLVRAADLVLTKPGYSIISEAVAQKTPLAYAPREGFVESQLLQAFLDARWPTLRIERAALADGSWIDAVAGWDPPRDFPRHAADGARHVARIIRERVTPS